MTNAEVEDVLSSIRRLVSDEKEPEPASPTAARDRLVLTPALRVSETPETENHAPEGMDEPMTFVHRPVSEYAPTDPSPDVEDIDDDHATPDGWASEADADPEPWGQSPEQHDPVQDMDVDGARADWEDDVAAQQEDAMEAVVEDHGEPAAQLSEPQATGANTDELIFGAFAARAADTPEHYVADEDPEDNGADPWPMAEPAQDPDAPVETYAEVRDTPVEAHDEPLETHDISAEVQDTLAEAYDAPVEAYEAPAETHDAAVPEDEEPAEHDQEQGPDAGGLDAPSLDDASLSVKVAALESLLSDQAEEWEPDHPRSVRASAEVLDWDTSALRSQKTAGAREDQTPDADGLTWQEEPPEAEHAPNGAAMSADQDVFDAAEGVLPEDILDEEALRELVAEIVRQELQGALGERITRNVRKLVRREIHRAFAAQDLD
ncbi:MAG: hypothetical protein AAGL96_12290 [Pseudomonadota bacterium]